MKFLLFIPLIALIFFFPKIFTADQKETVKNLVVSDIYPKKTPFPFEEITIPYLRSRTYESLLSELKIYRSESNYKSYLTSYDSDGIKINGLLTIPSGQIPEGGHPAIVFVHGYIAPSVYETTTRYVEYVDYLAKNGFVVFKIDLRGHGDSEGEAGGSYYSSDYIIDTLNAYSALQNSNFINPNKIALWGHSMAGNVTFRSFVAKKDIPAVVVWAGAGFTYTDLLTYRINDQSYRPPSDNSRRSQKRQELRNNYGEFDANHDFWKQVTPINYLDGVTGAISFHHAIDDSVVSVEYSRNINRLLNGSQISHQLNEYTSGGHNITGSSFSRAMQDTVSFLKDSLSL